MTMQHKSATAVVSTPAGARVEGAFAARFATLEVIDHDGDVILPGAIESGKEVAVCGWNHDDDAPPVGVGVIRELGSALVCEGRFYTSTAAGRDTYQVVKERGQSQEWSFGFRIIDAEQGLWRGKPARLLRKLDVIEVSPVLRGAGIGTGTIIVKSVAQRFDALTRRLKMNARRFFPRKEDTAPVATRQARFLAECAAAGLSPALAQAYLEMLLEDVTQAIAESYPRATPDQLRSMARRWLQAPPLPTDPEWAHYTNR